MDFLPERKREKRAGRKIKRRGEKKRKRERQREEKEFVSHMISKKY